MRAAWLMVCLMVLCAAARPGVPAPTEGGVKPATAGPSLPRSVDGQVGVPLILDPSEALLAAMPGVRLERLAYGESQVALVNATGLRENHPPAVCLRAGGFEIMNRAEEQHQGNCLVHLLVRRQGLTSHFYFTYLDQDGAPAGTCGYWTQLGAATWRRLTGRQGTWTTLQVLHGDASRAKAVITELIRRTR